MTSPRSNARAHRQGGRPAEEGMTGMRTMKASTDQFRAALDVLAGYTVERQFIGELAWDHVETGEALSKLAPAYVDIFIVAELLRDGSSIRNPFAFYRARPKKG